FALFTTFLLAIELCRNAAGRPALFAAALLFVSPLFFAQSVLAQLDAPAMLFTSLALLFFLQDRLAWSAGACVALVMGKETGIAAPVVFIGWLLYERRWREAAWFLPSLAALAGWVGYLAWKAGNWGGNEGFVWYNLYYPLHPVRLGLAFLRRIYYLG